MESGLTKGLRSRARNVFISFEVDCNILVLLEPRIVNMSSLQLRELCVSFCTEVKYNRTIKWSHSVM